MSSSIVASVGKLTLDLSVPIFSGGLISMIFPAKDVRQTASGVCVCLDGSNGRYDNAIAVPSTKAQSTG